MLSIKILLLLDYKKYSDNSQRTKFYARTNRSRKVWRCMKNKWLSDEQLLLGKLEKTQLSFDNALVLQNFNDLTILM